MITPDQVIKLVAEAEHLPLDAYQEPLVYFDEHYAYPSDNLEYDRIVPLSDSFFAVDMDTGKLVTAYCGPFTNFQPTVNLMNRDKNDVL